MNWLSGTLVAAADGSDFGDIVYSDFRIEADKASPINLRSDLEILEYSTIGQLVDRVWIKP